MRAALAPHTTQVIARTLGRQDIAMDRQLELHYRDELREARAAVLRDSEAFPEILFAIERTGAALTGRSGTLDAYRNAFNELANRSALASRSAGDRPFGRLYDLVQHGRNEALHQGAFARNLAGHATDLALVLEDALSNGSDRIADYMVRAPVIAQRWQPLRVVRHQILASSFSFLPLLMGENAWRLVSDLGVARVLRQAGNKDERALRLSASIDKAVEEFGLRLEIPQVVKASASVTSVLDGQSGSVPVLVVTEVGDLLGIATPFDLL